MPDPVQWVTDTSVYTHLCRAGHASILETLAPGGIILVPDDVDTEIRNGNRHVPPHQFWCKPVRVGLP